MKHLHKHEKEELRRILSQNGQERSHEMVEVLDTFLAEEGHQKVSDLHRRLKARGFQCDQEFVQGALDLFCHYGFAQTKDFKGRDPQYEHRHLGLHHDHLICTRCGRVDEFVNPVIEDMQTDAAKDRGFVPLDHRLEIYGLCRECARRPGESVTLCEAEEGERLVVCGYQGGEDFQRRLNDMGLTEGMEIEVLSSGGGPVVVACRGSRLAIGRGMSEKIVVAPSDKKGRRRWFKRHRARRAHLRPPRR